MSFLTSTDTVIELFISKWKALNKTPECTNLVIQPPVKKKDSWLANYLNVTPGYTLMEESYELKMGQTLTFSFFKTIGTYRGRQSVVYWVGISTGMDVPFYSIQDEGDMDEILDNFTVTT